MSLRTFILGQTGESAPQIGLAHGAPPLEPAWRTGDTTLARARSLDSVRVQPI